jgi:tRNA U34 2-thiouridine synthase MnmA/TrmU
MEVREKTNIKLFLGDETENYYILSNCSVFDYGNPDPDIEPDGYSYILPKRKSCFKFKGQDQELLVFVERVDVQRKQVYVSQTHWLFMRNVIENRLGLHVKIIKRYPGKVTVASLRMPEQKVNKIALKTLAEEMQEKIYIKPAK